MNTVAFILPSKEILIDAEIFHCEAKLIFLGTTDVLTLDSECFSFIIPASVVAGFPYTVIWMRLKSEGKEVTCGNFGGLYSPGILVIVPNNDI